jgi:hypothetical protein
VEQPQQLEQRQAWQALDMQWAIKPSNRHRRALSKMLRSTSHLLPLQPRLIRPRTTTRIPTPKAMHMSCHQPYLDPEQIWRMSLAMAWELLVSLPGRMRFTTNTTSLSLSTLRIQVDPRPC